MDDTNLNEICEVAKQRHNLSQNALASRVGMSKTNFSAVLHGRRKLPAEAAIELFDLTGIHPKKILHASVKVAASVMIAVVILFLTPPENAQANQAIAKQPEQQINIMRMAGSSGSVA